MPSLVHEPQMQAVIMTVKSIDPNVFTDVNVSTSSRLTRGAADDTAPLCVPA
jgi:hypothetical protein